MKSYRDNPSGIPTINFIFQVEAKNQKAVHYIVKITIKLIYQRDGVIRRFRF